VSPPSTGVLSFPQGDKLTPLIENVSPDLIESLFTGTDAQIKDEHTPPVSSVIV
jgi:hypothetical protein